MNKYLKYLKRSKRFFNISVSIFSVLTLVGLSAIFLFVPNPAIALTENVGASNDAYIDQRPSKANSNYGDEEELLIRSEEPEEDDDGNNKRSLVAFELPDLPDYAVIDSVTLTLFIKTDPAGGRIYGVHRINEDWNEDDITWNTKPEAQLLATSILTTTGTSDDSFVSWDVTSDALGFYNETYDNYGWMIKDQSENNGSSKEAKFRSKEYDDDVTQRPELSIDYHIELPEGSISGYKFDDLDGDGEWDQEGENPEPLLEDWMITLYEGNNTSSVTTDENGYYIFENLADGEYTVCENMPDDEDEWTQTFPTGDMIGVADCDGTYGYDITISGENSSEENNFGNVQLGSTTLAKVTNPSGDLQEFDINLSGPTSGTVGLRDGENFPRTNMLLSGTYTVTEDLIEGWDLTDVTCLDEDENIGENEYNSEEIFYGKSFTLESGHEVTCTFTNTKRGSVTVLKASQPDGTFDFNLVGETDDGDVEETQSITTEDGNGEITFDNLYPGQYDIRETVLEGWKEPTIDCLLNGEEEVDNTDFELPAGGNVTCTFNNTEYAAISGTKFEDMNANGVWDEGEDGLSDWDITLTKIYDEEEDGQEIPTVETSENGNYIFSNLDAGTYRICEERRDDWTQSMPASGESCGENGLGYEVTIEPGQTLTGQDFGNYQDGLVTGSKFEDINGNGGWDEGEQRLATGWTIELYVSGSETLLDSKVTDEDGNYSFSGLKPGDYTVKEVGQDGWIQKMPSDSDNEGYSFTLTSGETEDGINFGNFKKPTITVYKYNDLNGDGDLDNDDDDSNEPGLLDVAIAVGRQNGEPTEKDGHMTIPIEIIAMSLTGSRGDALFALNEPGNYKVFEEKKNGWQATSPVAVDSFFDITYNLDSITTGDPDFDLLRIGDPDFDLLRSSFFDVFIELSGQNINSDNQEKPLIFLNHLIPSPTPTPTPEPTPTPTPENNGGGGGGNGIGEYLNGPLANNSGTVAGATTTPTPTPTPTFTPTPTPTSSGQSTPTSTPSSLNSSGSSVSPSPLTTPTESVTPEATPSETPTADDLFGQIGQGNFWGNRWIWLITIIFIGGVIYFFIKKW